MAGIGNYERASIIAEWIDADANQSKVFWQENAGKYLGVPFEEVESANGVFGYSD